MSLTDLVAERLRDIRQQQNLTLKQVEIRSRGKWKAVVIGSYERGARALSIAKAEELCEFYGVPLETLFTDRKVRQSSDLSRGTILDLRKIRERLADPDVFTHQVHDLVSWVAAARSDWNGEVMSLRRSDNDLMMILTRKQSNELTIALMNRGYLLHN
jgi:transcriptional regulator with XRE-family HTH domain